MRGIAQPDGRPLGTSELRSYFRRFWTKKVHRINCAGVSVVCKAVFPLTMSCCVPEIFAIKSRSCLKSCRNFDVFGPSNLREGATEISDRILYTWITIEHVAKFGEW